MTKKQFNREYFVRVRKTVGERRNFICSYDNLLLIFGDKADRVFIKVERACACKVVVRPFHGVEITFIAH